MRIVQVSAHFPPELVSGGTLQPERIARGLRRAGHEVRVLAGSLDEGRADFEQWTTTDDTGLEVEWIATNPYSWWDAPGSFDNPEVAAAAAALYDRWRPDLVHCHSLQRLGVGPIDAAADRGIPIVVTMHDFWWVCARQFLVDTDDHPCCLVVAASDCPCEAGRPFLDARTERLRAALDRVQVVLAPSAIAAEVLAANGIAHVEVDENGLPAGHPATAPVPPRGPGRPLVVRYTGGSDPMKGADVLVRAIQAAGPLPRLRVVAHDLGPAIARAGLQPDSLPIELVPPYRPEQLDDVFRATDVLLVPSVMRETFSIVTREALERSVPVVATEGLGPEEVVVDGRNGWVLPADDPEALTQALHALDADPTIVDRWRRERPTLRLRSVDDQVEGLVARYAALVAAPRAQVARAALHVLFVVGIEGAPLRYRAHLPAEALELLGHRADVRHHLSPELDDLAEEATHIVVYRAPATTRLLAQIERWRAAGIPVAFDVDDLIFDPDVRDEIPALRQLPPDEAELWLEGVRRYRTTMEACDAYIGSTDALVEHATNVVGIPAVRFSNGVGRVLGAAADRALRRPRAPGPLRVGYLSGTTTHDDDWRAIADPVLAALERHPDAELWLVGHLGVEDEVAAALGPRLHRIPFVPWAELPDVLRDLDVNLAPLAPGSRFNDAKSAIKWLEAALCATPTVASPTRPFVEAIDPFRTGCLATTPDEWRDAIDRLLTDAGARGRMGRAARRAALLRWSPPLQGARYVEVLGAVATAHQAGRVASPAWTPVVRDEPPSRYAAVEPYPPARLAPPRRWLSTRAKHERSLPPRWRRGLDSLRTEGVVATLRRALRRPT